MEYIVILEYNTGQVFSRELTDFENQLLDDGDNVEQFFKYYHLNMDECNWMFTSTKPALNYLTND